MNRAFVQLALDWREPVVIAPAWFRPAEIAISRGYSRKSREIFGWQAKDKIAAVDTLMVKDELQHLKTYEA